MRKLDWTFLVVIQCVAYGVLFSFQEWRFAQILFTTHIVSVLSIFAVSARQPAKTKKHTHVRRTSILVFVVALAILPIGFVEMEFAPEVDWVSVSRSLFGDMSDLTLIVGLVLSVGSILSSMSFRREDVPR
jgi:hypothetical protein